MPADSPSSSTANPLRTVRINRRQLISGDPDALQLVVVLWKEAWTKAGATRFVTYPDTTTPFAEVLIMRAIGGDDAHPILLTLTPGSAYAPGERSDTEPTGSDEP